MYWRLSWTLAVRLPVENKSLVVKSFEVRLHLPLVVEAKAMELVWRRMLVRRAARVIQFVAVLRSGRERSQPAGLACLFLS